MIAAFEATIGNTEKFPELNKLRNNIWEVLPHLENSEQYGMKAYFASNVELRKTDKQVNKAWKMYQKYSNSFYATCSKQGFFANLELFPGAVDLIDGIIEIGQGKLPMVLTAPVQSVWCAPEKQQWIEKHFPGKFSKFICQKAKYEFAAPGSVLVDDLVKNTIPWMENGGGGVVLYKGDVADAHKQIKAFMDSLVRQTS